MKKQFSVLLAVIACFVFLSCSKDSDFNSLSNETLTGKANKGTGEKEGVPFKGFYNNTHETLQGPPMFKQRVTGHGQATHLGESVFVAISNVNLTTPPPFAVTGTRTFTAANGDQFFTTFTGFGIPGGSGANLHEVIVGGTGRFQNASGSFDSTVKNDASTSTYTVTFNGYINF